MQRKYDFILYCNSSYSFLKFLVIYCYVWLSWLFVAVCRVSVVVERGFLIAVAPSVSEYRL